ncbi:predicted protein [Nematostella vectensis]|uniref:Uncharacterized protein n=1 Tax=Nematostella vectensis TaxID=45351 RepID=A7S8V1_NEMVE|nr:predicted protein [Nematostella vectensis]|eukprot:XP_001631955.1 predicted protein [Nematostella vectensis]
MAMLAYRTTSLEQGYSLAELLDQRAPDKVDYEHLRAKDGAIKERQKQSYDRRHGVLPLPPLQCGDEVWIPDRKQKGTVIGKTNEPRSYQLSTPKHNIRRNRRQLNMLPKPDPETPTESSPASTPEPAAKTTTPEVQAPVPVTTTRSGRVVKTPARLKD